MCQCRTDFFGCVYFGTHSWGPHDSMNALTDLQPWVFINHFSSQVFGWAGRTQRDQCLGEGRDNANESSNIGPVNGFKKVATLQPESDEQVRNQTVNKWDDQAKSELNQIQLKTNWITEFNLPASKLSKQTPNQLKMPNVSLGMACRLNDHRPELTRVILVQSGVVPRQ